MTDKKTFKIDGTAYWAHITKTNPLSDKYQMDVGQLDNDTVEKCLEYGLTIRNKEDERGNFITVKSSFPPRVLAADLTDVESGTLLGNGSKVKVAVTPYEYTFKGKKGIAAGFNVVQVTDLIKYQGVSLELFEDETKISDVNFGD